MKDKQETIKELEYLRTLWNEIKEEQFRFDKFVSIYNREAHCGTVCCLFGWMPKLAPEYDVVWMDNNEIHLSAIPSDVFNWPYELIESLFYGGGAVDSLIGGIMSNSDKKEAIEFLINTLDNMRSNNLSQVLQIWDTIIEKLKTTNTLDPLFIY